MVQYTSLPLTVILKMKKKKKDLVDLDMFDKLILDDIINDSTAYVPGPSSDQDE